MKPPRAVKPPPPIVEWKPIEISPVPPAEVVPATREAMLRTLDTIQRKDNKKWFAKPVTENEVRRRAQAILSLLLAHPS